MGYQGPPPSTPPPPDWRPLTVLRPAPPRSLPPQDHAALDAAEQTARHVTYLIAAVAGLVALVVAGLLLTRAFAG